MAQHTGKVVWFSNSKGFGFLASDGAPDVFVSGRVLQMQGLHTLNDGDTVEFETEPGADGRPQASRVTRLAS